jgi:hypothetical protein
LKRQELPVGTEWIITTGRAIAPTISESGISSPIVQMHHRICEYDVSEVAPLQSEAEAQS